ncbi:MAG: hypothetical protein KDB79_07420 [Acidobacteria bacterium]|nr:hypothetical protein [Acidobacteriota bacterium]
MRIQLFLVVLLMSALTSVCSGQNVPTVSAQEGIVRIARSQQARAAHTATRLHNGTVLVLGGMKKNGVFYDEAEVFDPVANTFTNLPNKMTKKRVSHSATLLNDGRVLILGGWSNRTSPDDSAEFYDPKSRKFAPLENMRFKRSGHSATLLDDGKVLIAGGNEGARFLNEAELFDPATNTFQTIGPMNGSHARHSATKLEDGRVLILGGEASLNKTTADAEIYDPQTNKFRKLDAKMNADRYKHDAVLLTSGKVLLFGGSDEKDRDGKLKSAELFDPATETFTKTGDMNFARFKIGETAVVLQNGKVLVAAGSDEAEVFDPATNTFEKVSGGFGKSLHFASVTLLEDGRALILGGYEFVTGGEPTSTDQAWIFQDTPLKDPAL